MPVPAAARLVEFVVVPGAEQPRSGAVLFTRPAPPAEKAVDREAEASRRGIPARQK